MALGGRNELGCRCRHRTFTCLLALNIVICQISCLKESLGVLQGFLAVPHLGLVLFVWMVFCSSHVKQRDTSSAVKTSFLKGVIFLKVSIEQLSHYFRGAPIKCSPLCAELQNDILHTAGTERVAI